MDCIQFQDVVASCVRIALIGIALLAGAARAQTNCLPNANLTSVQGCGEPRTPTGGYLRTLGWACKQGETSCVNPGALAGNADAEVIGFYSLTTVMGAKQVEVVWTCPDSRFQVIVDVSLRRWHKQDLVPCAQSRLTISDMPLGGGGESEPLLVSVKVSAECAVPTYLVARVSVPAGFRMPIGQCSELKGEAACLLVYSNHSAPGGFDIAVGSRRLPHGVGQMDRQYIPVSVAEGCILPVRVDFHEAAGGTGRRGKASKGAETTVTTTQVAEIRF